MSTSDSASNLPDDALSALDRRIILATQAGMPVHERPFDVVAREVDSDPQTVMQRFNAMLKDGRTRRIGAVPNHYRLGYTANGMSVWDVDDADTERAGELVGALEMVSHCYLRPRALPGWPYNLFAMVHGHYREEVIEKVDQIATMLGDLAHSHDILFSTRILKKTGLRIS